MNSQNIEKKKCAIFTMVRDEKVFLPIWLKYYSKYFNGKDIYIIDHETKDNSIEECKKHYKFNLKKVNNPFLFPRKFRQETIRNMQEELLKSYQYVLFTDIDEIIIPNLEKFKDLKDYLTKFKKDCVRCNGFELIHIKNKELEIDLNKSILSQRNFWYQNILYSKPLLSNKLLNWCAGFHNEGPNDSNTIDKELYLLHLHKMDLNLALEKHIRIAKMKRNESKNDYEGGPHNKIDNKNELEQWFYKEKHMKNVVKIPDWLKNSEII